MRTAHHVSHPVGVGKLMYVGDDCQSGCANQFALTMCKVGLGVAVYGLVTGNKPVRNAGAIGALLMFIAI